MFFQVSEYHLHLFTSFRLILTGEGRVAVVFTIGIVNYHRFRPDLHILICGVVNLDVEIIRPAAYRAFLV